MELIHLCPFRYSDMTTSAHRPRAHISNNAESVHEENLHLIYCFLNLTRR